MYFYVYKHMRRRLVMEEDVKEGTSDKYSLRGRVFSRLREDILNGKYDEGVELREIAIGE